MPRITLHTIETPTVYCHDRSLHIDQIVFAQTGSEFLLEAPLLAMIVPQIRLCSKISYRLLDLCR